MLWLVLFSAEHPSPPNPGHHTPPSEMSFPKSLCRCPFSPPALRGPELDAQFLWLHLGINEKS